MDGASSCTPCGYDTGSENCIGLYYKSYYRPDQPSFPPSFSLELPSTVRSGTPITVKLYSEDTNNEALDRYGVKFHLFQGAYFNTMNRVIVDPQQITGNYLSATFNANRSIPAGVGGNGKQFIVAYDSVGRVMVGGVVITLA